MIMNRLVNPFGGFGGCKTEPGAFKGRAERRQACTNPLLTEVAVAAAAPPMRARRQSPRRASRSAISGPEHVGTTTPLPHAACPYGWRLKATIRPRQSAGRTQRTPEAPQRPD